MKKVIGIFLTLIIGLTVGCQSKKFIKEGIDKPSEETVERTYSIKEVLEYGDIINIHGSILNDEKLDVFLENINNKIEDQIKIVQYTIEGDPIIVEVIYDGKELTYIYDNTRDNFGVPNLIEEKYKPEAFYKNNLGYFIKAEEEEEEEEDILIFEIPSQEDILYNIKTKEEKIYSYLEDKNIINDYSGSYADISWVYEPTPKNLILDSNAIVKIKVKSEEDAVFFNEMHKRIPFTPYNVEITEVVSGDLSLGDFKIYNTGGIVKVSDYINQISEEEAKLKGYLDLENKEESFLKFNEEHFYRLREGNEYLVILVKQENGIYTSFAGGYSIFAPRNISGNSNDTDYENVISADTFKIDTFTKSDENTFIGVISEINNNTAIVDVESGNILSSSDKVVIELLNNEEIKFKVGDRVKVSHSGLIRESYPAQVDTLKVEKLGYVLK